MEQKTIKVSRKKLVWAIIILVVISVFWYLNRPRYFGYSESSSMAVPASAPMMDSGASNEMMSAPDYYRGNPDITDTRQFLKTNYSADIKTRDVKTMARNAKSIITEAGGRIDNIQESAKYSSFSFVVAKSKFETFRDEIESLTHAKLITTNISAENLLGQKQSIEEQMQSATSSLASLETQKASLVYRHTQALASLNAQLIALQNQGTSTTDQQFAVQQNINVENSTYNNKIANLNNQIDSAKKWIAGVEKQDTNFTNNIETVNGYISISWASYWQIAKIYSPINPIWLILILIIIAWKILGRFGITPKIELV